MLGDRQDLALYRDEKGSSALHDAIEYGQYETALAVMDKYPSLIQLRDIVSEEHVRIMIGMLFLSTIEPASTC